MNAKHYKIVNYASLAIAAAFLVCSCSEKAGDSFMEEPEIEVTDGTEETPVVYAPLELSRSEQAMVEGINGFGIDFLKAASAEMADGNLMYSIPCISTSLSMIANMMTEESQNEMSESLGVEISQLDALNSLNSRIAKQISYVDEDVRTNMANSTWLAKGIGFNEGFINTMKESYGAEIFVVEPTAVATMESMNAWVSEKTDGMINSFFNGRLPEFKIAFLNAMYFNGAWTDRFDRDRTAADKFKCYNGIESDVMMMQNGSLALPYMENKDAKWLKLYFGKETFAITFIMPENDINEFIAGLTKADIETFNASKPNAVTVNIPRMKLDNNVENINDILKRMIADLSSTATHSHQSPTMP